MGHKGLIFAFGSAIFLLYAVLFICLHSVPKQIEEVIERGTICDVCKCYKRWWSPTNKMVHVDCSVVSDIPKVLWLSESMLSLDVSNQPIHILDNDYITSSIDKLRVVLMENCMIETMEDDAFSDMFNLRELDLSNNKIETISKSQFKDNTRLVYLSLKGNMIRNISHGTFLMLKDLKFLDLSHNKMSSFDPSWIVPRIIHLFLNHNELTNFRDVTSLKSFKHITLHSNNWACNCEMKHLHSYLMENKLSEEFIESSLPSSLSISSFWKWLTSPCHQRKLSALNCSLHIEMLPNVTTEAVLGDTFTISCLVSSNMAVQVTWWRNYELTNKNIYVESLSEISPGNYMYDLHIPIVKKKHAGYFQCEVSTIEENAKRGIEVRIKKEEK